MKIQITIIDTKPVLPGEEPQQNLLVLYLDLSKFYLIKSFSGNRCNHKKILTELTLYNTNNNSIIVIPITAFVYKHELSILLSYYDDEYLIYPLLDSGNRFNDVTLFDFDPKHYNEN